MKVSNGVLNAKSCIHHASGYQQGLHIIHWQPLFGAPIWDEIWYIQICKYAGYHGMLWPNRTMIYPKIK